MRSLAANALLPSYIHDSTIAFISCDALAPLSDTTVRSNTSFANDGVLGGSEVGPCVEKLGSGVMGVGVVAISSITSISSISSISALLHFLDIFPRAART